MSHSTEVIFRFFQILPLEIRLMVWEHTWPPPRVIEAAYFGVWGSDDYEDLTILRPAGTFSNFLSHPFDSRILGDEPLECCPNPVALAVCYESRHHTLKHFVAMEHAKRDAGSFYLRPRYDLLWFSIDFLDEKRCLHDLVNYYGDQLRQFQAVLVDEDEWLRDTPGGYTVKYLAPLGPLDAIHLVYGDIDDSNELVEPNEEELSMRAQQRTDEYARLVQGIDEKAGRAKHISYLDRYGKYYV